MDDLSSVRLRAWETRRAKYGERGHSGGYRRGPVSGPVNDGALMLVIDLMNEGVLSEGQVAQATGLDRVEIRTMADARPTPQGEKEP